MKKIALLLFLCCLIIAAPCYAGERQELFRLATGDIIFRQDDSIVILFKAPRTVLSTSIINGGYRDDLQAVLNHDSSANTIMTVEAYMKYMAAEAARLGFDPEKVSSMGTGARMDNVAIRTERFQDAVVTAVVTAGVEGNAGRAGDPTDYYKPKQKRDMPKPGTINIMLVMNADMPRGTLARALVTCTEAKTAALQELMVSSRYSSGLATGSGTDQSIVIANPQSNLYLDDTGKHSKLGELIGLAVKAAVKEALAKQNGLTGQKQHSVIRRMERFGITKESLYQAYLQGDDRSVSMEEFSKRWGAFDRDKRLVTKTSLYVHLLDQYSWGLLSAEETAEAGNELIVAAAGPLKVTPVKIRENSMTGLVNAWKQLLLACMRTKLMSCQR